MVWIFILFLVVFICALMGIFNEDRTGICHFIIIMVACAGIILSMMFIFEKKEPVIGDVPDNAHVDTIKTIHGSDTVYNYRIEWNDDNK